MARDWIPIDGLLPSLKEAGVNQILVCGEEVHKVAILFHYPDGGDRCWLDHESDEGTGEVAEFWQPAPEPVRCG